MNVLVAYASRHGATIGIAERIADGLRAAGSSAEARSVKDVRDVDPYDAFVIGSAAYMFHWLKEATAFVKRHRAVLAERPVWLFSSGPLGADLVDAEGRDIFDASRPKEFDELRTWLRPRGDQRGPPLGCGCADADRIGHPRSDVRAGHRVRTGGTAVELLNDVSVRITPLTEHDASQMLRTLRTFPLLDGYRDAPKADVSAVQELLLRVSCLTDHQPDIAELDCNPVIVDANGAIVVDARVLVGTPVVASGR